MTIDLQVLRPGGRRELTQDHGSDPSLFIDQHQRSLDIPRIDSVVRAGGFAQLVAKALDGAPVAGLGLRGGNRQKTGVEQLPDRRTGNRTDEPRLFGNRRSSPVVQLGGIDVWRQPVVSVVRLRFIGGRGASQQGETTREYHDGR